MLKYNPKDRLTAEECLYHDWFKKDLMYFESCQLDKYNINSKFKGINPRDQQYKLSEKEI
jgi:serine/threonine protein kinase